MHARARGVEVPRPELPRRTRDQSEGRRRSQQPAVQDRRSELPEGRSRRPDRTSPGSAVTVLQRDTRRDQALFVDRAETIGLAERTLRNAWLQRQREPRRRRNVADLLRAEEVDWHRREKDRHAREESGEIRAVSILSVREPIALGRVASAASRAAAPRGLRADLENHRRRGVDQDMGGRVTRWFPRQSSSRPK
jgi:hypothetical protein